MNRKLNTALILVFMFARLFLPAIVLVVAGFRPFVVCAIIILLIDPQLEERY
jgi:hypothetical protein